MILFCRELTDQVDMKSSTECVTKDFCRNLTKFLKKDHSDPWTSWIKFNERLKKVKYLKEELYVFHEK